jgi:multidrug efflux pump subunit AcrB
LTAITTVLGLIPLAIGLNINFFTLISDTDPQFFIGGDNAVFWGTMAKTVIYGLIFATFLTLIVVPVMYWLFYRMQLSFRNIMGFNDKYDVS